ncbi:hypothetical protein FXN61_38055, partial [Lentzea sp. PSKA42]|nr:hypothetical protein [Lentzea indica]
MAQAVSPKAFLTGVLVAGVAATSVLVTSSDPEVLNGRAIADEIPVVGPGPVADSLSTGRGADLTGLVGGANTANARPVAPHGATTRSAQGRSRLRAAAGGR